MSRRTRFIDRLTQPAGTLPALVWAACILLILALTVIGFPKGALSTDILDLLPSSSADVRTGELASVLRRRYNFFHGPAFRGPSLEKGTEP